MCDVESPRATTATRSEPAHQTRCDKEKSPDKGSASASPLSSGSGQSWKLSALPSDIVFATDLVLCSVVQNTETDGHEQGKK